MYPAARGFLSSSEAHGGQRQQALSAPRHLGIASGTLQILVLNYIDTSSFQIYLSFVPFSGTISLIAFLSSWLSVVFLSDMHVLSVSHRRSGQKLLT